VSFSLGMIRCVNAGPGCYTCAASKGTFDHNIVHSGGAIVIVQHATQASASLDWSRGPNMLRQWKDQPIPQPLVITLGVIVGDEVAICCSQRLLDKQDHALQTRFLNGPHESLSMCIQIRRFVAVA